MKIALNKMYVTNKNALFTPVKTRKGNEILEVRNMFGKTIKTGHFETIFIDKNGNELKRCDFRREYGKNRNGFKIKENLTHKPIK